MTNEKRVSVSPCPTFYTNNVSVEASSFDVKLRLGQVTDATPEQVTVNDLANVYMSLEHFRSFVRVMNNLLHNMEAAGQQALAPMGDDVTRFVGR